jgi:prepilin-type N-terminal cleavage/methylation domain-containing protein
MNNRGLTLIEMMIAMVIGLIVLGLATGIAINETRTQVAEQYRIDVDGRANNLHKLMRRDVMLAGSMASSWDSLAATEVNGDTLIVRFSELDEVKYYLNGVNQLYREDVVVGRHIQSFTVTEDSVAIQISLDVGAERVHRWINNGNLYHRSYKWTVIPRTVYYRNRGN